MGQLRASLDEFDESNQVGDWCILNGAPGAPYERNRYIAIRLTDADDGVCILLIVTQGDYADPALAMTAWYWDGNREAPTLDPSILHHSTPPWHGYLRAGQLVIA